MRKKDEIDALIEDVFSIGSYADSLASYYEGSDSDGVHDALKIFVARAVLAERERCFKIADKFPLNGHEIADAIRGVTRSRTNSNVEPNRKPSTK